MFERAGCGFSPCHRAAPAAVGHPAPPELAGAPFEAMGVSLVFPIPATPMCPRYT